MCTADATASGYMLDDRPVCAHPGPRQCDTLRLRTEWPSVHRRSLRVECTGVCRRQYRVEYTGSLPTSEVKRRRARSVLGWGTAWEHLRVLSAFYGRPGGRQCSRGPESSVQEVCYTSRYVRVILTHVRTTSDNGACACNAAYSDQRPEPSVRSPESRVQSPEPRAQSPSPSAQSPAYNVQSPESSDQSPDARVQRSDSRVQRPEYRVQSP